MLRKSPRLRGKTAAGLLVAAAGTLALLLTPLSSAFLFSRADHAPTELVTGTISVGPAAGKALRLDASNLRAGQLRSGLVELTNSGTAPGDLTLTALDGAEPVDEDALLRALHLSVQDCEGAADCATQPFLYQGSLADVHAVDLGVIAAGGTRSLRVVLAWPTDEARVGLQGRTLDLRLRWELRT